MKILIGAPVYKREWILPHWFEALENQDVSLNQIGFIFETASDDKGTKDLLFDWHAKHPQVWHFDARDNTDAEHVAHHVSGVRKWQPTRYQSMVILRNSLLAKARALDPDFYLSLDTDVLFENPSTITELIKTTEYADAVSPLMYMTPMTANFPNVMSWVDGRPIKARRGTYPIGERFQADVIMAAKLMTPKVFHNVDYQIHRQGEDLGWSANCFNANYKLYCASDIYTPHIMSEEMLETYLKEGDSRANPDKKPTK